MTKQTIYRLVFIAISIADVVAAVLGRDDLHNILKPLIMISLIVYYLSATSGLQAIFVTAMLGGLGGDIFLLYEPEGQLFFILGLGSFLIVHILLTITYRRNRLSETKDELAGVRKIRLAFPVLLAGIGLMIFLLPSLGRMKLPVLAYTAVLTVMILNALFRFGRTTATSFWFVFSGAVLFAISDSILAIDKFAAHFVDAHACVMLTYCMAQYFITEGIIEHERVLVLPSLQGS